MSVIETLKNKHLIVALLVTPLLAVFAWYSVGWMFDESPETPAPAVAGANYPLIEMSGCRYGGGLCRLENEDFRLNISVERPATVIVESAFALDGLILGLASSHQNGGLPAEVSAEDRKTWKLTLEGALSANDKLRIVAMTGGSQYYGEASLTFLAPRD